MVAKAVAIAALLTLSVTGLVMDGHKDKDSGEKASEVVNAQAEPSVQKPDSQVKRLLRAFDGTWSITDELAPDTSSPKGKTGTGTIVWHPGPGGFSVIEEFRSKQGEVEVTGLGAFWWDELANGFHTIWCDSTNPGGCIDFKNTARWDGSNLVLQEDYEAHGKKYTFKEVFGDITANSFTQTLYGGESGGLLKVDETIHAKRRTSS